MFNFKIFFENFIVMFRRIDKKGVLFSMLLVLSALFCFNLFFDSSSNDFSKNDNVVLSDIHDEIIPASQPAKDYINQKNMELRCSAINNRVAVLEKIENEKNLRGTSKQKREEEVEKISDSQYETLLTIVEAEATNEDLKGKILIANVVLNRVKDAGFPNDIEGVVFQRTNGMAQFSPIDDGRFYEMTISDDTREAVKLALEGVDYSDGALFFVAKSMTSNSAYSWFDNNLEFLFDYGVHSFYKY